MSEGRPDIIQEAQYIDPGLPEYAENPLISALPEIMDLKEAKKLLRSLPSFNEAEINIPPHIRVHAIARITTSFFQPLSIHIVLERKLSQMIRQGYLGKNPKSANFKKQLNNGYEKILQKDLTAYVHENVDSTASSMALFGVSGSGKTTTLNRLLSAYPRAIYHSDYNLIQVPWLKVDCPHDGSISELCLSFFYALDRRLGTNYAKKYGGSRKGIGYLLTSAAQLANIHVIGVLVIDEFQHLSLAKGGGSEKILNFLVTLVNTIGVSVIIVGTPQAMPIFAGEFRQARRSTGEGSMLWDRLKRDESWDRLVEVLWKYQWLSNEQPIDDDIKNVLYDLSQGVFDILIKLFCLAQSRAILIGKETITTGLLKKVYEDEFIPVHKMLAALKSGDPDKIAKYGDLKMPAIEEKMIQSFENQIAVQNSEEEKEDSINSEDPDKAKSIIKLLNEMGIANDIATPLVTETLNSNPEFSIMQMIHRITGMMAQDKKENKETSTKNKSKQFAQWQELPEKDLRKIYSDKGDKSMYSNMQQHGSIFEVEQLFNHG
ncbi:MAG: ATP-binding protein [Gammaproteobacteria bacterium]|nr:ATP-binding protein [Gammaproteobacteria bacterium]